MPSQAKRAVLYARVTPDVKAAVEKIAAHDQRSVSQTVTLMVQKAVSERNRDDALTEMLRLGQDYDRMASAAERHQREIEGHEE